MVNNKKLSVVIPCYNEEQGIEKVLTSMPDFIDEIIVVDNHCTDRTAEVATDLGAYVVQEPRRGYGRAYKTGLKEASGEIIITMDGDFTYPTFAISYLLNVFFEDELDFLSARRIPVEISKKFNNVQRYMGNLFLTSMVWILFRQNIKDSQSGMWIFWKRILPSLTLTQDGMAFSEELKLEAFRDPYIKSREVPIQFKYLERVGDSKLHLWKDGMRNLLFLFKKRFNDSGIKKDHEAL